MAKEPWAETSIKNTSQQLTISISSLLLLIVAIPLLVLLWQLKSLLLLVMISVVLACSIAPVVDWNLLDGRRQLNWVALRQAPNPLPRGRRELSELVEVEACLFPNARHRRPVLVELVRHRGHASAGR